MSQWGKRLLGNDAAPFFGILIYVKKCLWHWSQNTLSVPQVSRDDLGATLSCHASNNNVSAPAVAKVTIDLKCK